MRALPGKPIKRYSVGVPRGPGAFQSSPSKLDIPLSQLREKYQGDQWDAFEKWAQATEVEPGKTVMEWLASDPKRNYDTTRASSDNDHRAAGWADGNPPDDARRIGRRGAELAGGIRYPDGGAAFDAQDQAVFGAHLSAVIVGNKPLYHEELGREVSQALLARLRPLLPTGVEAHEREGHLYVYGPGLAANIIRNAPADYPGRGLLDQIHRATLAGENGDLLGFGGRKMLAPGSKLVRIFDPQGRVVSGFWSRPESAAKAGADRARDFSDYTGQNYRVVVSP